jgi:pimeloyl-ACP methyl ester carboxylesterase
MTERLQPTAKNVTVNGLRLRYLEWGRPDALPVVCLHGYTSSAEAFNALARRIHDRAHVIAMDVRGHGESAWSPDGAYQYADQAGDLATLVDRLGLDRFLLIGTSMGGVIAMVYAMQHAGRLRGLALNDIGPDVEAGSSRITQTVGTRPNDFASLDKAMQYRREISPITAGRPIEDQEETARGVVREQPDGRWVWKMDPAYIDQRIKQGPPKRPALWPVLETLPCPTQVVWGTTSDVLSEAQAKRMVSALPKGELVSVPGIGHAPTLIEPPVLAALDRLLASV